MEDGDQSGRIISRRQSLRIAGLVAVAPLASPSCNANAVNSGTIKASDFPDSRPSPQGRVKGTNVHPTPAQFLGPTSDVWVNFWAGGYDWAYVKESIDRPVPLGINVVRIIGSTNAITDGSIARTRYLANHRQVASYCRSIGIRYYPCAASLTHRGAATDSAIINEIVALYQAMIPYGNTIFGFDMYNEYRDDSAGLAHAATMVANTAAAIRRIGNNPIPITASIHTDITNADLIRAIAPHVDYLDFHLWQTLSFMQSNPNLFSFLQLVTPGLKVVVGEMGTNRSDGSSAQQRADYYTAARVIQQNTPQQLGTINWAAIDDNFGLYDYTTRTLQADISGAWALFPNT
ncbi:MAG: hypothetical protein JOZ09_05175 [Pseudonocardiales bacterium]|jgi:hypothetical protein|nr:hypothetical protein [Pseudonocardiales bacterium]